MGSLRNTFMPSSKNDLIKEEDDEFNELSSDGGNNFTMTEIEKGDEDS